MHRYLPVFVLFVVACETREMNGEDLFEKGQFSEAVDFYTNYLEAKGFNSEIQYNRGRAYEEMNNLKAAKADYDLVLVKDQKHLNARLSLSRLAYESGNYSKSLIMTGEALKHHEGSSQAHFLLARARHQLGNANAAMEAYNTAISLSKNFGDAYLYRGALKTTLKIKSACDDFSNAKKMGAEGAKEAVEKYCS